MRNPEDNQDVAGRNGFIWWIGVVEARNDPLKLGRCQVRIAGGWHSDNKMKLPTADLPWALPSLPVNNSNPYAPKEGDMVFGFFLDGANAKEPVMTGVMPGIPLRKANPQEAFNDGRSINELMAAPVKPDETGSLYPRRLDEPSTSRLARNEATHTSPIIKSKNDKKSSTFELPTAYNARYPYNNAMESESGHAIEIDDTPNSERLHFYHRKGSYQEYRPDGSVQAKVVKDSYQAVDGNKNVYVKGNYTVNVDGNLSFNVKGSISAIAGSSISTKSGTSTGMVAGTSWSALAPITVSMTTAGKASVTAGGMASMTAGGIASVTAGAAATVTAGAAATLTGATAFVTGLGLTTISGSTVNILGAPVGGAAGAAAAGGAAAGAIGGVDLAIDELGLADVVTTTIEGVPVAVGGVLQQAENASSAFLDTFDPSNLTDIDPGAIDATTISQTISDPALGELSTTTTFYPDGGNLTNVYDSSGTLVDQVYQAPTDAITTGFGGSVVTADGGLVTAPGLADNGFGSLSSSPTNISSFSFDKIISGAQETFKNVTDSISQTFSDITSKFVTASPSELNAEGGFTDTQYFEDGSFIQTTMNSDGTSVSQVFDPEGTILSSTTAAAPAGFADQVISRAQSVGNGIVDAASKVDPLKYVETAGKDLATSVTQPFLNSAGVIEKSMGVLTNPASTFKDSFVAAKAVLAEGATLYGTVSSIPTLLANPQQLLTQYALPAADAAASDFTRNLNNSSVVSSIKGDLKTSIEGFTQKVRDTYSDTSKSLNSLINKSMDDFGLESKAVAAEVADNLVNLREQGYTEAELRQLMPDVIKQYPTEFAKAYKGAPTTSNAVAAEWASGGVIV